MLSLARPDTLLQLRDRVNVVLFLLSFHHVLSWLLLRRQLVPTLLRAFAVDVRGLSRG